MGDGDEDEKLKNATLRSLEAADDNGLKSIVFPAISAGIFGFPIDRCAEIMLSNSIDYLKKDTGLEKIIFCLYGQQAFDTFKTTLERQATSI